MQHPQIKCCMKNLTIFKFEPTATNTSQHILSLGARLEFSPDSPHHLVDISPQKSTKYIWEHFQT